MQYEWHQEAWAFQGRQDDGAEPEDQISMEILQVGCEMLGMLSSSYIGTMNTINKSVFWIDWSYLRGTCMMMGSRNRPLDWAWHQTVDH